MLFVVLAEYQCDRLTSNTFHFGLRVVLQSPLIAVHDNSQKRGADTRVLDLALSLIATWRFKTRTYVLPENKNGNRDGSRSATDWLDS